MSKINIKYLSDETTETLRSNLSKYTKMIMMNPDDSSWIENVANGKTYTDKKYQIEDFELISLKKISKNATDEEKKVMEEQNKVTYINNSIKLYEHLKHLPRHILTSEQFWLWLMFDKFYQYTNQLMPIKSSDSKVFTDHWLFTQGGRRGLFFGVLSRDFFKVDLSINSQQEDPYLLTRFILENPERFRNLSWRSISSEKNIVIGTLKGEMKIHDEYKEYDDIDKTKYYTEIAKSISKLGSVKLLDVIDSNYVENYVYHFYKKMIEDDITSNNLKKKMHKKKGLFSRLLSH